MVPAPALHDTEPVVWGRALWAPRTASAAAWESPGRRDELRYAVAAKLQRPTCRTVPGCNVCERGQHEIGKGQQVGDAIRASVDDDDSEGPPSQTLLELEIGVHRDERVDVPGRSRQVAREVLVKQDEHGQSPCRGRLRAQQPLARA